MKVEKLANIKETRGVFIPFGKEKFSDEGMMVS